MARDPDRDAEIVRSIDDPFIRRTLKVGLHTRRYMPFYVFGVFWLLVLTLFPSIRPGGGDENDLTSGNFREGGGVVSGDDELLGDDTTAAEGDGGVGSVSTGAGSTGSGSVSGTGTGKAAPISAAQAKAAIQRGTGTTRLGMDCGADVRQIPASTYAIPCQNVYDGANGGATHRGITAEKIKIVARGFPSSPNEQAVDRVNEQAGFASDDVNRATRNEFVKFFTKAYELYGRQVEFIDYESQHGGQTQSTDEAQGKGKENACLDADQIAKEIKAFAVFGSETGTTSNPFSECAAERGLVVFNGGAYYPELWYRQHHPYLWGTLMECERISYQVAEYAGKRLINKPAKWAGSPTLQAKQRYFGTYVPDNDGYQHCVRISRNELKNKWGVKDPGPQYNYVLDVSRFPDQAANAAVQFSAAGVTTVILACDYISTIVLTQAAEQQNWFPEWLLIGVAATDTDNAARLYSQQAVVGSLFGMSQLGPTPKVIGKNSEAGRVYKVASGKDIPEGTTGSYFYLVHMFNMLQAAGPNLTPATVAQGAMTIPPGGAPEFPFGYWSMQDGPDGKKGAGDHTEVDDSREIYWTTGTGPDGKKGTYKETMNGARFRNDEWPGGDPQIYPGGKTD